MNLKCVDQTIYHHLTNVIIMNKTLKKSISLIRKILIRKRCCE